MKIKLLLLISLPIFAFGQSPFFGNTKSGGYELPTTDLILYLDANNASSYSGSGSIWYDLSANNEDFTISGATFTSGSPSYFLLDGTNDRIYNTSFGGDDIAPVSVFIWYYPTNIGYDWPTFSFFDHFLFQKREVNNLGFQMNLRYVPSTTYRTEIALWEGIPNGVVTANTGGASHSSNWSVGSWQSFAFTTGGTNGDNLTYYLNGVSTATTTLSGGRNSFTTEANIGYGYATGRYSAGRVSIVIMYSKELTSTEILNIHNNTKSIFGL